MALGQRRHDPGELEMDPSHDEDEGEPILGDYACCILWTAIHPITWMLPFIGHMGVCDSSGLLHDWGGGPVQACPPKHMAFGQPCRYIRFRPKDRAAWDAAIARADDEFLEKMHLMGCGPDCHSHVARALNLCRYGGCNWHNKVELAAYVFFCGRHIGVGGFVATWLGAAIVVSIYLLMKSSV